MVVASNGKKKKTKSGGKRKPVNLRSNYNSKFDVTSVTSACDEEKEQSYEKISFDMYPSNDHADHKHIDPNTTSTDIHQNFQHYIISYSICSDGKLKPSEVIEKAASNGVQFMSLTDHDTMAGVNDAMDAAQKLNVVVFPGVEISAEVKGGENLHILGYFHPGSNSTELEKQLEKIRNGRHTRGKEMLRKLSIMGVHLKWDRVLEIAGEAAPGRPHVAEAMVEASYVSTFKEAFAKYLHNDGPAYVEGEHFPPDEAIKLIASSGGVSVLAHPWCCKDPIALVPQLAEMGIHGIEVYHDEQKIDMYGALAKESSLLRLGGSDFHGIDPNSEQMPGAIPFPKNHLEIFLEHAKQVWKRPLTDQIQEMINRLQMEKSTGISRLESLRIWKEHEDMVKELIDESKILLDISEEGQYRRIRLSTKG